MVWPPYLYNLPSCNSALTDEATLTSACPQMQKTRVYTVIFAPPAPSIQNALLPNTPCLFPYLFQAFAHLIFMRPTLTAWLNTKTSPTTHMYTEHSTLQSPLLCYVSLLHNSYHLLWHNYWKVHKCRAYVSVLETSCNLWKYFVLSQMFIWCNMQYIDLNLGYTLVFALLRTPFLPGIRHLSDWKTSLFFKTKFESYLLYEAYHNSSTLWHNE